MSAANHSKAQLWEKRLREFQKSNLTVTQFCESVRCSQPTFYHWKRRLEKPAATFLQIQTHADHSIQIKLTSGVVLSIPLDAIDSLPSILEHVS